MSGGSFLINTESIETLGAGVYRHTYSLLVAVSSNILEELPGSIGQVGLVFDDISAAGYGVDGEGKELTLPRWVEDYRVGYRGQAYRVSDLDGIDEPEAVGQAT